MYHRLSEKDKSDFAAQIAKYCTLGWWRPASRSECESASCGPPAHVFAIEQKSRLRLVCDLREFNSLFMPHGSSVSEQPSIALSISALRVSEDGVVIGDCSSAFYKVRLKSPIWIHAGPLGDFLCFRMTFGMSCGPEGLEASLGVLWKLFSKSRPSGCGSLYVDDFWLCSPDVMASTGALLHMLSACGFDVATRKFQSSASKDSLSILGVKVALSPTLSVIDCQRRTRLEPFSADLVSRAARSKLTKSRLFALSGALSYDAPRMHLEAKVCADLLRSISGAVKCEWDVPLDVKQFDKTDTLMYHTLLDWIESLVKDDCDCKHSAPRPVSSAMNPNKCVLRLSSDASLSGGAFVLEFYEAGSSTWTTIYGDAWVWSRTQTSYHTNRLEAIALFRGLRGLSQFAEFQISSKFGERGPDLSCDVFTDSMPALAWATKGPGFRESTTS